MKVGSGPWLGLMLAGLSKDSRRLDEVGVAQTSAGPLTVLRVPGSQEIDFQLFLGAGEATVSQVLAAAVDTLDQPQSVVPGSRLPYGSPGPGVTVAQVHGDDGGPTLRVQTMPFTVSARHDLLASAGLFGLRTATTGDDHFPGITRSPLAIESAVQVITASFTSRGFRSAAVTAAGIRLTSTRGPRALRVTVRFDRPFGFLAVHRPSGLVLNAGWVADPRLLDDQAP
jgi:hypothetical protein